MVNLENCSWIQSVVKGGHSWLHLVEYVHVYWPDVDKLTNVGDDCLLKLKTYTTNQFWLDVFDSLSFVIKDSFDKTQLTQSEKLSFPVWFNSHIKVDNNSVFFKKSYYKGMKIVNDFLWKWYIVNGQEKVFRKI